MASACRIFYRNLNIPLSRIISTRLCVSSTKCIRHYSQEPEKTAHKSGTFAEFYEKTKENKQAVEEDEDFEVLLRNSNFINVIFNHLLHYLLTLNYVILFYSSVILRVNK